MSQPQSVEELKSNLYKAAGQTVIVEMMREVDARLEKGADLEMFQLESILVMLKNDIAPLVMLSMDPKLPFIYVTMKKIVESMIKKMRMAQELDEQQEYSYGFPAKDELAYDPGAFNYTP